MIVTIALVGEMNACSLLYQTIPTKYKIPVVNIDQELQVLDAQKWTQASIVLICFSNKREHKLLLDIAGNDPDSSKIPSSSVKTFVLVNSQHKLEEWDASYLNCDFHLQTNTLSLEPLSPREIVGFSVCHLYYKQFRTNNLDFKEWIERHGLDRNTLQFPNPNKEWLVKPIIFPSN